MCGCVRSVTRIKTGNDRRAIDAPISTVSRSCGSAHLHYINIQKGSECFEFMRDMPDSNGTMMCWTVLIPPLNEFACSDWKTIAAIRIANLENRPSFDTAFSDKQFKAAPLALDHRQQSNRARLDTHFDGKSSSHFAVIDV